MTNPTELARFKAATSITDDALQQELDKIWADVRSDPAWRWDAQRSGIDPASLTTAATPFTAQPAGGQFAIETIIVVIAAEVGKAVLGEVIHTLWEKYFWPRLEDAYGSKLKKSDDPR